MNEVTLRDWFAMNCPESEIPNFVVRDVRDRFNVNTMGSAEQWQQLRCEARYRYADIMMKVRDLAIPIIHDDH